LAIARVKERSEKGGLLVEENVIRQMAQKLEKPVERNWEKSCIKIDSMVISLKNILFLFLIYTILEL
jgi:predicted ABC-type ATPase